MLRRILLVAVVGLVAESAVADWAQTRWGMSPEEVEAAMRSKLQDLPLGEDAHEWGIIRQATMSWRFETDTVPVVLHFAQDGLRAVSSLEGGDPACPSVFASLSSRFGEPQLNTQEIVEGGPEFDQFVWSDPDSTDIIYGMQRTGVTGRDSACIFIYREWP